MTDAEHHADAAAQLWGWDLHAGRAVKWEQRGPGQDMLGPYPSRAAAEQWQQVAADRNEAWDDTDERWEAFWDQREPDNSATTDDDEH